MTNLHRWWYQSGEWFLGALLQHVRRRIICSLRKQPTSGDATTCFPAKWRLRKERRNSILMTRHYPHLGSDVSSVWNFCARFSDFIWRANQCHCRQMSAVFSGSIIWFTPILLVAPRPKRNHSWSKRPRAVILPTILSTVPSLKQKQSTLLQH